jgi:hypothetical protein
MKHINKARVEITNRDKEVPVEDDVDRPVVVCESTTLDEWERFVANHEDFHFKGVKFQPDSTAGNTGRFIIHDVPRVEHEHTIGAIRFQVYKSMLRNNVSLDECESTFIESNAMTCRIGNVGKEADFSLKPVDLLPQHVHNLTCNSLGDTFPTLVLEVAFENESAPVLLEELALWVSAATSVQVAIGIKLYPVSKKLRAIMFRRATAGAGPEFNEEFGVGVVYPAAGLFLTFPVSDLFANFPLAQCAPTVQASINAGDDIRTDLSIVRDRIYKVFV